MATGVYSQIAVKIIEAQEVLIGPVALSQAEKVRGMTVHWGNEHEVEVKGGASVIDELVAQYKSLFGQISVEVCKEAAARLVGQLGAEEMPASLR